MIFMMNERRNTLRDRIVLGAVVVLLGIFPIDFFPGAVPTPQGLNGQFSGKQGQIIVVKVPADRPMTHVQGRFLGRIIGFFPDGEGEGLKSFVGLLGIDMQDEPGTHELVIEVANGEERRSQSYHVLVLKEKFRVEHLKLPKDKVDLDDKAVARWKAEQAQVKEALAIDSHDKLWRSGFIEPVNGKRTGIFGSVRIMNGQPRNPHNGEDISAPHGTDVLATNDGVVRLTVDHFFSGRGIFLDHGLGFYSMYFHLADVLVKDGERVKAGQVIGKVGATGRATGPHLHWGVKLNGARVDPYAVLELPFKGEATSAAPSAVSMPVSEPSIIGGSSPP